MPAFLKISVVVAFLVTLSFLGASAIKSGWAYFGLFDLLKFIFLWTIFVWPFVLIAGVLVALPISSGLAKMNVRGAAAYGIVGFAAGSLVSLGILGGLAIQKSFDVLVWAGSIGALPGFAAGVLWWTQIEELKNDLSADQG